VPICGKKRRSAVAKTLLDSGAKII
jgi:hypothetical protein